MPAPKGNKYAEGKGRPTKYKEEYCEMLEDHMEEGLSYESFAGLVSVTRDCLYKWEKEHESFLYSKRIGKQKLLLYFEKLGRAAMVGKIKNFNAATYIFSAKNKIGWKDQVENTTDIKDISINIKQWDE